MANWRGGSMTAGTRTVRTGSILFRGRTSFFKYTGGAGAAVAADQPVARTDANSLLAHEQLLEKAKQGGIDIYFEGDSIVRRWGATDYPEMLANWKQNFFGWNAADFGWGADTTQNILWRLRMGSWTG